jgi:DNA-binding transcriptional MocR family regulator
MKGLCSIVEVENRYSAARFQAIQIETGKSVQVRFVVNCICLPGGKHVHNVAMSASIRRAEEPVYRRLANMLEGLILERSLRPGDRVPSVRQFSSQQRVSIPTVMQAYVTLESRGLIEARPKSGFYVRARLSDSTPEPQGRPGRAVISDCAQTDPLESLLVDLSNQKLVPLGAALPSVDLLPGIKLGRTMAAISRRLGPSNVAYDAPQGSEMLRREIARRSLEWGCGLNANDLVVTVGATEAVSLALRVTCKPGDTVIVESPTYFGFARMLRELRLNALPVPLRSSSGIDLDAVEAVVRQRRVSACLLIPNFHNPAGSVMPDECKKQLVHLMASRSIPVIEDDIFGDLQHEGTRPRILKSFDRDDSVILCSSYSKTLAPGYRVGFIAAGRWRSQITCLQRITTFGTAMLPAMAVAEFLKTGGYDRYIRSLRHTFRHQVEQMREAIVASFPEGIRMSRPKGGFLLWCELPGHVDSMKLFKQAREAGISIAPGPLFSPVGDFRNFIRINCSYPMSSRFERAVAVLGRLVRQQGSLH